MKYKCDYCGGFIEDTEEKCPNCGAVNEHLMRSADGVPKTIEELKAFCSAKKLPLEQMRFYIGTDFRQPKAFGIFKDNDGNFVVYKNKGSGERVERYRGKDEAYAVNEIYQKLRSEIQIRREKNNKVTVTIKTPKKKNQQNKYTRQKSQYTAKQKRTYIIRGVIIAALLIAFFVFVGLITDSKPDGYYHYHGNYYYYQGSTWYQYDDYGDSWVIVSDVDGDLYDNYSDYYEGSSYRSGYEIDDFSKSSYYDSGSANSDYNDDWDGGDWDWGGGDWDAGDTDWDTDW